MLPGGRGGWARLKEVVRVVLLDAQLRCITRLDITRGTVNESLAAPREIFRPAIIHSAYVRLALTARSPCRRDRQLRG